MRILIAGGSGLIGSRLSALLTEDGDEVTILSRNPDKVRGMPAGIRVVEWDGKSVQAWASEIEKTDAVVNLTGENLSGKGIFPTRWSEERKQLLRSSRVNSGKVLSEAIEISGHKPTVLVQASGIGFYQPNQPKALTEADSGGNDFMSDLSKEWEASSAPAEKVGVRRVVVRNGLVLSAMGGALRPILLPYKLFVGGPIGSGNQIYSWIHIDDEVSAIRFLIKNEVANGAFNLTAPYPVSNDEFGKTIAKVMGRPHYFPLPGLLMHLAFGEVASMVLEGHKVLPQKLLESGFVYRYPTLEEAIRNLLMSKS